MAPETGDRSINIPRRIMQLPSRPHSLGNRSRNTAEDEGVEFKSDEIRNGESIAQLRKMVMWKLEFTKTRQQYVAYLCAIQTWKIPFVEVQKQIADMLEDRILVGHAVHNDLKVCCADMM